MRIRLAALILTLGAFILTGCHVMQNKELDNPNRDDTGKMMQKAGGEN